MLNIRIIGICCHIDPRGAQDRFQKRLILLNARRHGNGHGNGNGNGRGHTHSAEHDHVPYVAFEADDVVSSTEPGKEYTVGNTKYRRWELDREQIIINPLKNEPFQQLATYDDLVPRMTVIAPDAPQHPRDECFDPTDDPDALIAGYFDIQSGVLMAGDRELNRTTFEIPSHWPIQRNAIASNLLVNWDISDQPSVVLRSIDDPDQERRINLTSGSTLSMTIGNQPQRTIENPNDEAGVSPREHFGAYYNLLPDDKKNIPKPMPSFAGPLTNGCNVNNWP